MPGKSSFLAHQRQEQGHRRHGERRRFDPSRRRDVVALHPLHQGQESRSQLRRVLGPREAAAGQGSRTS